VSDVYRIFGAEISPYSVKVRSYARYKQIPHEWIVRSMANMAEFQEHAKLPLIPLVIPPDGPAMQDSTPILEKLEALYPEASIHPDDPVAHFVSTLIEEFGDEWGNKWMFHYRWAREIDQDSAAERIAKMMAPDLSEEQQAGITAQTKARMITRGGFVGSNEDTAPQIEASFARGIELLDEHLANRQYLFGGRPAFGDFGLWGQLYNAWTDPTAGQMIRDSATNLLPWIERMLDPKAEGDFEPWSSLEPTLAPFVKEQVGDLFLPWSKANAAALAAGEDDFSVGLASGTWHQKPQKYHARSLVQIRRKYAALAQSDALDEVLEKAGCLEILRGE
jgi:glutathione S-transferase